MPTPSAFFGTESPDHASIKAYRRSKVLESDRAHLCGMVELASTSPVRVAGQPRRGDLRRCASDDQRVGFMRNCPESLGVGSDWYSAT